MQKEIKLVLGSLAATIVVSSFLLVPTVSAYRGNMATKGPNHTDARGDSMEAIMAKKDFTAWKKLMSEDGRSSGVLRVIDTQAEFNKFADAWALYQKGDASSIAKANQLRTELGLGNGAGGGQGRGGARGQNNGGNFVDTNKDGVCDQMQ